MRQAIQLYDACLKIIGQNEAGDKVKIENLTAKERNGLESLKRRVRLLSAGQMDVLPSSVMNSM